MYEYRKENSLKALAIVVIVFFIWQLFPTNPFANSVNNNESEDSSIKSSLSMKPLGLFSVYSDNRFIETFNIIEYAIDALNRIDNSTIIFNPSNKEIYTSNEQYIVYENNVIVKSFSNIEEAINYVNKTNNTYVIDSQKQKLIFSNFDRFIAWNDDTKAGDLFLVNKWTPITSEYVLEDFVNLTAKKSTYIKPRIDNMLVDRKAFRDLEHMAKDMFEDGVTDMLITSTYRPYTTQSHLFNSRVQRLMEQNYDRETAVNATATVVAKPGTSEHQTGLAIDITTVDRNGNIHPLNDSFVRTGAGAWARDNSWKYGYVVRYQEEKTHITGIIYEPWHLRYVGIPHAEIMYSLDYCLEEYLDYLAFEKSLVFTDYNNNKYRILHFESIYSNGLISTLNQEKDIVSISSDGKTGVILTTLSSNY